MKCSKCGTENPKNKNVCSNCGAFLYASMPNNRVPLTPAQKKQRRKALLKGSTLGCLWSTLIIIGMFIVLAILSFLVIRFILPDNYTTGTTPASTTTTMIESTHSPS